MSKQAAQRARQQRKNWDCCGKWLNVGGIGHYCPLFSFDRLWALASALQQPDSSQMTLSFSHISTCSFHTMPESSSSDAVTCPTLTGLANFEIWELQITSKLHWEKVLSAALDTNVLLTAQTSSTPSTLIFSASSTSVPTATLKSLISSAFSTEDAWKWMERDEKAHDIIQDHTSNALLIKMRSHETAKELFDALIEIHQVVSLPTAFYVFWQLFASIWDRASPISDHITSLWTLETWLAGIKFSINQKVLIFILLNSISKTPEWNSFTSSIINTVEETKLILDAIEVCILSEDSWLNPPSSKSALKVSNKDRSCTRSDSMFYEHH